MTPILVRFPKRIVEKLLTGYDPKKEVGGLILAVLKLQDGNRILEVEKVIFFKNLSSTPEKSFFRPDIKSDISKIWKSSLDTGKHLYLPIFFHSHPRIELSHISDVEKLVWELSPVATSEADQSFSLGLQISIDNAKFFVPNALIVQSRIGNGGTIVAFFGGGITPTDFGEYLSKLTGKTIEEIWAVLNSWLKEDRSRVWILVLLGLLIAIPIILILAVIILGTQIAPITRQVADDLPNYFGILKRKDTLIRIPKYRP